MFGSIGRVGLNPVSAGGLAIGGNLLWGINNYFVWGPGNNIIWGTP